MRQFAEDEVIIPTGRYAGLRFSCDRQPHTKLWFAEVDSGRWSRINTLGPTQSGKTIQGSAIPVMYHLFEIGEDVIFGVPSMDMAADKWKRDLLPVIRASRYRDYLPRGGQGSRGGSSKLQSIDFANGTALRFMTAGGDDKSRAGYTSRVVVISETDGMDEVSEGSRETDKVSQIEARTQSFDDRARIYMECTVSLETGRTWKEYEAGTTSRIAICCQHCSRYVTPEREHLVGWQGAADEIEAGEKAGIVCPECGAMWTEENRIRSAHDCLLVHRGQEITQDGTITGHPPRTNTLGFRWNAVNNLLVKISTVARKEWKTARTANEDDAEKEMNQFWWAKPYKPSATSLTAIDPYLIIKRMTQDPRGRVPAGAGRITIGIDIGKYLCHWVAIAWLPHASPHVLEYGCLEVATNDLGEERAILATLRNFRDTVWKPGWPADSGQRVAELVMVDAGYLQDLILAFCEESPGFQACKGFAVKTMGDRQVGQKTEAGWEVTWAPSGAGYQLLRHSGRRATLLDVQADQWKTWWHARIATPLGQAGAMTLHLGDHLGYAKHQTAERKEQEFIAGKGLVERWIRVRRNNHYLDGSCLAAIAGHALGERLIGEPITQAATIQQTDNVIPSGEWMKQGKRW
jgi:phage terminase large subunit GpA-like protein